MCVCVSFCFYHKYRAIEAIVVQPAPGRPGWAGWGSSRAPCALHALRICWRGFGLVRVSQSPCVLQAAARAPRSPRAGFLSPSPGCLVAALLAAVGRPVRSRTDAPYPRYFMPLRSTWLAAMSITLMMKAMAKAQMRLFRTHVCLICWLEQAAGTARVSTRPPPHLPPRPPPCPTHSPPPQDTPRPCPCGSPPPS